VLRAKAPQGFGEIEKLERPLGESPRRDQADKSEELWRAEMQHTLGLHFGCSGKWGCPPHLDPSSDSRRMINCWPRSAEPNATVDTKIRAYCSARSRHTSAFRATQEPPAGCDPSSRHSKLAGSSSRPAATASTSRCSRTAAGNGSTLARWHTPRVPTASKVARGTHGRKRADRRVPQRAELYNGGGDASARRW
jgi:hypothetical protein